jgi:hypothetical protein
MIYLQARATKQQNTLDNLLSQQTPKSTKEYHITTRDESK